MQLDGPDLEQLLVRARHEYGSDVRIVKADKVRSGGVGGFFAREHFALSIEVDENLDVEIPTPATRRPDSVGRPVSLLDLADAISDRENESTRTPAGGHSTYAQPAPPHPMPSPAPAVAEPAVFTPGIGSGSSAAAASGPALSTDGASFASILAGLTESVAERPAPQVTMPTKAVAVPEPEAEAVVAVRPHIVEPIPPRRTQNRVARRTRSNSTTVARVAQPISSRDLRDIGLPRELLPARDDGDLLGALVDVLRALPSAPDAPCAAGSIFAVVGEGEGAWDAAVQLARSLDLEERSVVYVTEGNAPTKVAPARRITALDQISTRVDRWRKRTTPTIVVVDAPMNVKAARWNRQALAALDAEAVWLVVPATRKTDDVARWASRLGRTDGLVVTDVDASSDPASVLQLGLPVAWLDGRPATPGAWAGLIVDRLVEAR